MGNLVTQPHNKISSCCKLRMKPMLALLARKSGSEMIQILGHCFTWERDVREMGQPKTGTEKVLPPFTRYLGTKRVKKSIQRTRMAEKVYFWVGLPSCTFCFDCGSSLPLWFAFETLSSALRQLHDERVSSLALFEAAS